jgi:hypothetical protein
MPAHKVCFFITPIGAANSPERKRADNIKKFILNEVLAGKYKVVRADELGLPGSITHQIIKLLYDADLVIADLAGANANVIYELAVRHAFNKVSIHIVDKTEKIPFDLKDERTIELELADIESIEDCKQELAKIIKVINKPKFEYSSPIFRVLSLAAATEEEKEDFLENMSDRIESIATDVSGIEIELTGVDFDEIEKGVADLNKDVYDIKSDIRQILDHIKK